MPRVVIVGGGISGLRLAYRLEQLAPAADVILLEQRDRPGGTLWTLRRDGFQLETGANGFLDNKSSTLDLCTQLGLKERLLPASAAAGKNRYLFVDGKLKLLPGGLGAFLVSDLMSWRGKLRFFWERFRGGSSGVEESIDAFARRRAGAEVAEVLADAMVTGIYAGDPNLLSLPACFPRLAELERKHGSLLKGLGKAARERRLEAKRNKQPYRRPGMWSLHGGLRVLVETLRERLKTAPLLGVTARKLSRADGKPYWVVHGEGQERWQADAVVLTCPAPQQAELLADVDAELAQRIGEIPYNKIAVVGLGFRRQDVPGSVDGFGFIAPQRTRRDVLGVQWCSSIFPERAPTATVLLRAMCGGWHRAEMVGWDDERLLRGVLGELKQAMNITAAPIFHEIIRWDRAIPQYHVGHLERVAWVEGRCGHHPGLFLGGNAYRGVSLNDCTEQGELLARQVHGFLGGPSFERNA